MIYWPVLIVGLLAISYLLGGPPTAEMLEPGDPTRLVYMTVLGAGVIVGSGIRMLVWGGRKTLAHAAGWVLCMGTIGTTFVFENELKVLGERLQGELVPSMAVTREGGEVELRRAWDGHYRADALVNGSTIRLMVDTGASMVLIPYEQASDLGIDVKKLEYSMPVTTANGRSTVAPVRLASVRIGSIEIANVGAAVAHPGSLKSGLLGMSFLDQLTETSFQGDKLYLRQRELQRNSRFKQIPLVKTVSDPNSD
ncbi:MAG: TIGR02281 family clan AA aspartic protease [Pseudomonadota bacterium]